MVMQAVQTVKPGKSALHTQANVRASVFTRAATRGELPGSSNKNAPAKPVTGTRHRTKPGHNAPPVTQSSVHAVQV